MNIILHRVGIKNTNTSKNLPLRISGQLKSPIRTRNFVHILQDSGTIFKTGLVRRCGHGWLITDEADYAISFVAAVPSFPATFSGTLEDVFSNEPVLWTQALNLIDDGDELRDTPLCREIGYAEFVSRRLGFELNECADLATEGDYSLQDAQRVLTAALSAQAADLLQSLHNIDYRSRVVVLPTNHTVRGIDTPLRELNALAVYARGKVIHCLPDEVTVIPEEHAEHLVKVFSLGERATRAKRAKSPANPAAISAHNARENEYEPATAQ